MGPYRLFVEPLPTKNLSKVCGRWPPQLWFRDAFSVRENRSTATTTSEYLLPRERIKVEHRDVQVVTGNRLSSIPNLPGSKSLGLIHESIGERHEGIGSDGDRGVVGGDGVPYPGDRRKPEVWKARPAAILVYKNIFLGDVVRGLIQRVISSPVFSTVVGYFVVCLPASAPVTRKRNLVHKLDKLEGVGVREWRA